MNNYKFYKIYGLIIKSNISLYKSNLLNTNYKNYDAEISLGKINTTLNNNFKTIGIFNFSKNHIIFTIKDVATYEITNGNKITISPKENADLDEIKKFTIGSALGLLLFQRNNIAIHGSSVVINDNAIILSGSIGAGKTSSTSALINKGYGFLTDDVASVIKDKNGFYNVNHCIPYQKLCHDTVEALDYDISKLHQIDKIKNKYFSPEISNFIKVPKKLKALFYLTTSSETTEVTCTEISGIEKFNLIISNIFRIEFIPKEMINPTYIKEVLNLSKNISAYKITRPKIGDSINEMVNFIERYTYNN